MGNANGRKRAAWATDSEDRKRINIVISRDGFGCPGKACKGSSQNKQVHKFPEELINAANRFDPPLLPSAKLNTKTSLFEMPD